MTRKPQPSATPTPAELTESRRRFRRSIEQINAHQPSSVVRALVADLRSRSRKP